MQYETEVREASAIRRFLGMLEERAGYPFARMVLWQEIVIAAEEAFETVAENHPNTEETFASRCAERDSVSLFRDLEDD